VRSCRTHWSLHVSLLCHLIPATSIKSIDSGKYHTLSVGGKCSLVYPVDKKETLKGSIVCKRTSRLYSYSNCVYKKQNKKKIVCKFVVFRSVIIRSS
jgi:hypothetical protein